MLCNALLHMYLYISEKGSCEDAGRQPSASQEENPPQNPAMLTSSSQTHSLQNGEKINFCSLRRSVYVILLRSIQLNDIVDDLKNQKQKLRESVAQRKVLFPQDLGQFHALNNISKTAQRAVFLSRTCFFRLLCPFS